MTHYTPMESEVVRRLARALLDAGMPVESLRIFGSRARGHSSAHSDLDIAVTLASPPDRLLARKVAALGERLSVVDEQRGHVLRVQAVPFFEGEENGYLARAIAGEAETVWTKT